MQISSHIPIDNKNHRNFKVYGETQDLVLVDIGGVIYMNSSSREYLHRAFECVVGETLEIIDLKGKSRQYNGLSGFLLKTGYRTMGSGVRSIKTRIRKNRELMSTLKTTPSLPHLQGDE